MIHTAAWYLICYNASIIEQTETPTALTLGPLRAGHGGDRENPGNAQDLQSFQSFPGSCPMSHHPPTSPAPPWKRMDPWRAETQILRLDLCSAVCCPSLSKETIHLLGGLHSSQLSSWMTWIKDARPWPTPTVQEKPPRWPLWDQTTQLSHQKMALASLYSVC